MIAKFLLLILFVNVFTNWFFNTRILESSYYSAAIFSFAVQLLDVMLCKRDIVKFNKWIARNSFANCIL